MDSFKYDVSFVVVMYNADEQELYTTLDTIFDQQGIAFEVIIADDGSKRNYKSELESYFRDKNFSNYKLVLNPQNRGTVQNLYSGLEVAEGKYIKDISPGDYLYGKKIIRQWMDFNDSRGYDWTFSDAIYYACKGKDCKVVRGEAYPRDIKVYEKDFDSCRWNYAALSDITLGAAILCKTETQKRYIEKILGKVIFAEDHVWRLMMFDGIAAGYFPQNTILYEYGSGVSTSNSEVWRERLDRDWKAATEIMMDTNRELTAFQRKIIRGYKRKNHFLYKYFVKGNIKQIYLSKHKVRYTDDYAEDAEGILCRR